MGLGRGAIEARVRAGRLIAVHRAVYAVGYARLTELGRCMAGVLACGEGAVGSHRAAAFVWRMRPELPRPIEVTTSRAGGRKREGILVHRSRLEARERITVNAIPVTTPGRTLIDLADVLTQRQLERAFDEAEYLQLDCTGIRVIHGRPGSGRLATVMARHRPGSTRTRSEFEEMMLALCRAFAIEQPELNYYVEGYECDCVWPGARLVVELDGWEAHRTRRAFERDRRKDARLLSAGWLVVRYTWARLDSEPEEVARELIALLRPRRRRAALAAPRRP